MCRLSHQHPFDHQWHDLRRAMPAAIAMDPQSRCAAPEVGEGGDRRGGRAFHQHSMAGFATFDEG